MSLTKLSKTQRVQELRAAVVHLNDEPVPHPRFVQSFEDLELASDTSSMTLLLGVSGAGKSYMSEQLVRKRCEAPLREWSGAGPRLVAARVTAPSTQRGAFPWKGLWTRTLDVLADPLPDAKFDPAQHAAALRAGVRRPGSRSTEVQLFEAVRRAGDDRGLELLVIDEACSLTKSDAGRTLSDQLDVLRDLADLTNYTVVLVSTFRIVSHLQCSSELNRRLVHVVFDRYYDTCEGDGREDDYLNFCRVALSLMKRVPAWARMPLHNTEYRRLYNGSLGCVGVLSDWWRRALGRCVRAGRPLVWSDFEHTPLDPVERAQMQRDAELAAQYLAGRGASSLDCPPSQLPDAPPPPVCDARAKSGRHRRGRQKTQPPTQPRTKPPRKPTRKPTGQPPAKPKK